MASGRYAPHQQVEHMAAPTSSAELFESPLPKESRPHMASLCRFLNLLQTAEMCPWADVLLDKLASALDQQRLPRHHEHV